jgi:hypothetical protein
MLEGMTHQLPIDLGRNAAHADDLPGPSSRQDMNERLDTPRVSGRCAHWQQFGEEVHRVEHFAVSVVELEHADIDHPHREHLGHPVAPRHAPTTIDSDVLLDVCDVVGRSTELEKVAGNQVADIRGVHVQAHERQPPVAGYKIDVLSIGSGTYTERSPMAEG